jgi:NADPH2:quinone reductase
MRAIQVRNFGLPESHGIEALADPVPGPGEVLIDIKAATVNYADLLVITGQYQTKLNTPFVPGKEAAGVVRSIGVNVTRLKAGDRVLIHVESGAFATQAIAHEDHCMPLPETMPFTEAGTLGLAAQTAWFALLERGAWEAGDVVFVTGATGAVGHAAVQIASAHDAIVLAGVNSIANAKTILHETECTMIDLNATDLRHSLRKQVYAATGGHGADIVIDPLGGDVFDASLRTLAWCGRIVTVGFASGRIPEVKANYLLVKNITASGLQWTDYLERQPLKVARAHAGLTALWETGKLRSRVAHLLPMHDFAKAFQLIGGRNIGGRIVLAMD